MDARDVDVDVAQGGLVIGSRSLVSLTRISASLGGRIELDGFNVCVPCQIAL